MRCFDLTVAALPLVALVAATAAGARPAAPGLGLPLTAAALSAYAAGHPGLTLPQLLAALPETMQTNVVFVARSGSTQQATPALPRQIMFGADARFLLAVGAVPGDPHAERAEFAEFDPQTGRYHYGTLELPPAQPPRLTVDAAECNACHGPTPRPIWGQYPDWSGAYGDAEAKIATADQADFAGFVATAAAHPSYAHLRFTAAADGSTFALQDRIYPVPNTNLNHELGNTVALGAVTRMRATPGYPRNRWAVLATSPAMDCIDSTAWDRIAAAVKTRYPAADGGAAASLYVQASRGAGVDPEVDLSLERLAPAAAGGTSGTWQTGAFQLQEAVAFQLLDELRQTDPLLAGWLAPVADVCDAISRHMALTGEARAVALRQSYAWFQFFAVFDALTQDKAVLDRACGHIADQL